MSSSSEPRAAIAKITPTIYRASIGYSPLDTYTSLKDAEDDLRSLGETQYLYLETTITKTIVSLTD